MSHQYFIREETAIFYTKSMHVWITANEVIRQVFKICDIHDMDTIVLLA